MSRCLNIFETENDRDERPPLEIVYIIPVRECIHPRCGRRGPVADGATSMAGMELQLV